MAKEELNKEAEEYELKICGIPANQKIREAYIAGAKAREKRIAELEKENADLKAQVEKLQKEKEGIIHQEVVDMYSRFPC